jgi:hypothetical protein
MNHCDSCLKKKQLINLQDSSSRLRVSDISEDVRINKTNSWRNEKNLWNCVYIFIYIHRLLL